MRTRSFYLGLFLKSLRNDQKCIKPKKKKKLKLFKRNCDHSKNDHNTSVIHV